MDKAAKIFSKALTPTRGQPDKTVVKTNALLKAGKTKQAAKLFRKIVLNNIRRESEAYIPQVSGGYGGPPNMWAMQAVMGW
jgi:hypothetical protein